MHSGPYGFLPWVSDSQDESRELCSAECTGANYSYDFGLGYDVCAFTIEKTAINTLYRGQHDNGSWYSTFDAGCVNTLETMASDYALSLVWDPTSQQPRSNLTGDSLPVVCKDVARYLQAYFPQECKPFMNKTIEVFGGGTLSTFVR